MKRYYRLLPKERMEGKYILSRFLIWLDWDAVVLACQMLNASFFFGFVNFKGLRMKKMVGTSLSGLTASFYLVSMLSNGFFSARQIILFDVELCCLCC